MNHEKKSAVQAPGSTSDQRSKPPRGGPPRGGRRGVVKPVAESKGGIQSIRRAVAILDAVAERPDGISLSEISAQLNLNNSTVFHLVKTLASLQIVDQIADTKHYRVGSKLFRLAAGAMDDNAMLSQATPILETLSLQTGEAAHLAVRSQHEIVVIARTAATGLLQLSGRTGMTRPAHATAIGKILFAQVSEDGLDQLLENVSFQRFTDQTITDADALKAELDVIRQQGVGYDKCELDEDVKCVAMPVWDFAGRCVAAIGFSGPLWRLGPAPLKKKTAHLKVAATELSAALGYSDQHDQNSRASR